jgi:hypothetical protein
MIDRQCILCILTGIPKLSNFAYWRWTIDHLIQVSQYWLNAIWFSRLVNGRSSVA